MTLAESFKTPTLADTSFLSNLVFTGNAILLKQVLNGPVHLTPVILDPLEPLGAKFLDNEPISEILRPLFIARKQKISKYSDAELPLQSFVGEVNNLWQPVILTRNEVDLAIKFRNGDIWQMVAGSKRLTGLDPGEAETIAVAIERKWNLLIDDQAGVELIRSLNPSITVVRTCQFLVHAVDNNFLDCKSAEYLFNELIRKKWGFYAKRPGTKEHLYFSCNPTKCVWK